ncbi:MAG: hypothetical protein IJ302_00915 [Clostridia bacterium]|nr:hypothetical protein [Clostridia bacterium]
MNFYLDETGYFSFSGGGTERIFHAPLGIHVYKGCACLPTGCSRDGEKAVIRYPHGDCILRIEDKNAYIKITLCEVPEGTTGFIFGPYETGASGFGEILGAGWYEDGSVVCIQSLMPKVEEGIIPVIDDDRTGFGLDRFVNAASRTGDKIWLHCSVKDRTQDEQREDGFVIQALDDEDGLVAGASIALLFGRNGDDLLDHISEMELNEGLPHPTYLGSYAKKDKRVSSFYFIFDGPHMTNEERIEAAKRAHVSCVYFCDVIAKWGHFTINRDKFPDGVADVARSTAEAYDSGIISGAHSLSNFIHTNDEYVTPIPHDQLLILGTAELAEELDASAQTLTVINAVNCTGKSTLNVFRIDDELITFTQYDPEKKQFAGCTRGAFGTAAAVHTKGTIIRRLADHPYKTLFPDIHLQKEMADRLGHLISDCGIRKMSFDGLEGCYETGHGKYGVASYVKRVLDIVGSELLCDSSLSTHYLWHAFSYNNWGEPIWDTERRGGTHVYRARNQIFFKRNLIPCMLGWYMVFLCSENGRWEATSPENMEFILSRSAAYDAGAALWFYTETVKGHGLINTYYDMIRMWNRFRLEADIPIMSENA